MPGAPAFHRRSRREGAWPAPERQAASARVRGAASIRPSHRSRPVPGSGKIVSGNCGKYGNCMQCRRSCCCWQAKHFRRESPGNRITLVGRLAPTYRRGGGKSGCGKCANPGLQWRRPCCCWQAKGFRRESPSNRITFVGRLAPTYRRDGGKSGCGNCANPGLQWRRPCCCVRVRRRPPFRGGPLVRDVCPVIDELTGTHVDSYGTYWS
jgi:hypothetical protein